MSAPVLSPARLDALSDLLGRARPSVCTLRRQAAARDAGGATTGAWADAATVSCRVSASALRQGEGMLGGMAVAPAGYDVAMPRGTDVRAADRVVVGGKTLEIDEVTNALESFQVEVVAHALLVQ